MTPRARPFSSGIATSATDHRLDDTLMLAVRWAAAGNQVERFVAPDMPHGFAFFPCAITARFGVLSQRWFERVLA